MWLKWTLFCSLIYFINCDDGLCGLEPPKEGESCSGAKEESDETKDTVLKYDYEEKPLTAEEEEIWARRFYPKIQ